MELTKKIIEDSFLKSIQIFKDSNIGIMDNEVELEYLNTDEFIEMISHDELYRQIKSVNVLDDIANQFPIFIGICTTNKTLSSDNKTTVRKVCGLPYEISIDFNKAKKLLRPYSRDIVEKFLITSFLSNISTIFQESVIELHNEFYMKVLEDNNNDIDEAKRILKRVIAYLYAYLDVEYALFNDLFSDIFILLDKAGFDVDIENINNTKNFDNNDKSTFKYGEYIDLF